jgi:AcrR family transcriptional regulator
MAAPRQNKALPEHLERVARQAEELFLHEGFLQFGTDDLARRLRCSKTTLYTIAPNLDAFLEFIIERLLSKLNQNMASAANSARDWASALRALSEATTLTLGPGTTEFVRDLTLFPVGIRARKQTENERLLIFEQVIASAIKAGAFRKVDPKLAACIVQGIGRAVTDAEFLASSRFGWLDAQRAAFQILYYGLARTSTARDKRKLSRRGGTASRTV